MGKDAGTVTEYKKTIELKPGVYQAQLSLGMHRPPGLGVTCSPRDPSAATHCMGA